MENQTRQSSLLSLPGLIIAFGLPSLVGVEYNISADLSGQDVAITLAATPWLVLCRVIFTQRIPLASIGLRRPAWSTLGFGLAGIVVYGCRFQIELARRRST